MRIIIDDITRIDEFMIEEIIELRSEFFGRITIIIITEIETTRWKNGKIRNKKIDIKDEGKKNYRKEEENGENKLIH